MALSTADTVRMNLGESIPTGGTAADTLFTDDEIQAFLDQNGQLINRATAMGWRAKAAQLAGLVDVQEGNSSRKMSQAYDQAMQQAKYWASLPENPLVIGQTRIGTNRRSMPW